ncbi:hypothetical protein PENTCL1PPCAC_19921 [Pristionchus entomophagus]|uniref:Abnormal cell migration protein 18-like fibronectin type I domain-containing protein n=1 Tax=Pristionchus entomophagus TaxID=358040 RepID=A0AAV5TTZ6_9BILA|nr:hypothetical protein PENTCL1PPCAC_19921 [Pristionchus entomophagus]
MLILLILACLDFSTASPITTCPGGYKNGDKIIGGQFVRECYIDAVGYSINIIGCLTSKGTEVLIGTKLEEDENVYACITTADGRVRIKMSKSPSSKHNLLCEGTYENGQKYNEGSMVMQCTSTPYSWKTSIIACLTPHGRDISLGGQVEEGHRIYSCTKTENGATISTPALKGR